MGDHIGSITAKVVLHIVFSTKNREHWIEDSIRPGLHAYLAGACRAVGSKAYRVGGTDNHVHIACTLPRTLTVNKLLEEIKKSSSAWVKKQDGKFRPFAWQAGYRYKPRALPWAGMLLCPFRAESERYQFSFKADDGRS